MNLLLQPDPADPQQQFYDHPADESDVAGRLAELARLGWRPVGKPCRVLVDGRRHARYRLVHEPREDDAGASPCQHASGAGQASHRRWLADRSRRR